MEIREIVPEDLPAVVISGRGGESGPGSYDNRVRGLNFPFETLNLFRVFFCRCHSLPP